LTTRSKLSRVGTAVLLSSLALLTLGACTGAGDPAAPPPPGISTHQAVTSVTPANATPAVAVNWKVLATFSEPMDPASITAPGTLTVTGPFTSPVAGTVAYDEPSRTAIFTPTDFFSGNTTYNVMISTAARNLAGVALESAFVWNFSTAVTLDTTAPLLSFTAPAGGDASVAINRKIVATFNEAMDPATIVAANVLVTGPGGLVDGTVTYAAGSGAATFTPASALASSTTYTVTVKGVAGVEDLAGNPMAADFTWTFGTAAAPDTLAPRISSVNPAGLAGDVPLDKRVNATFTEAMDPLTIVTANFTLATGATPVTGTVAYDALNNIATFTPLALLSPGTTYTALLSARVTDLAGNALAAGTLPTSWSFTTAAAAAPAILIDLKLATPFAIASAAGMTNTPTMPVTTVNGNVLLSPTTTCNGVAWPACGGTAPIINGTVLAGLDAPPLAVKADLLAAYLRLSPASLPGATVLGCGTIGTAGGAGALLGCAGNATLPPGVYVSATGSTIGVTGVLTLDGQGDANAQFVFQVPSALTTAAGAPGVPGSELRLINGAKASNVWWQVGSSATIGTYARFQGNLLANTSITMGTGASSCGRLLAGAVTASGAFVFDSNVVSVPGNGCPL
jgi:ice-binding like protein/Big-like domain-containing protein